MNMILHMRQALALAYSIAASGNVLAEPVNGWWWNPNESGRGFFLEQRNGVMYLAGYFYDAAGRATWLSSGGPMPDPYVYHGTLQAYRNGQTVFGAYRPPDPAVDVGPIEVTFSDDEHGTLTWPGGTVPIEREFFGEGFALLQPQTGWWWNPLESGSGYSVEVQGESAFVVSFMYDDAGNPTWYFTAGPMSTPTHYEGDWLQIFGGQTMGGPYRPPEAPRNLGRVILDFASTEDATIQFVEGSGTKAGPGAAGTRSSNLHTQNPARHYSFEDQWPWWIGNMKLESEIIGDGTKQTEVFEFGLVFGGKYRGEDGNTVYSLQPQSWFSYHFHFRDDGTDCDQRADVNQISQSDEPDYIRGTLTIRPDLTYSGGINPNLGATKPVVFLVPVFETCADSQGGRETHFLTNQVMPDFVHFGDSFGAHPYSSSIYSFYPAWGYDLQRTAPHMAVTRRWDEDREYWQTWTLRAYP